MYKSVQYAVSSVHCSWRSVHGSFVKEKMMKFIFQLVTLVTGMSSSEQRLGLELSQWLTPVLSVVTPVAPNISVCVGHCIELVVHQQKSLHCMLHLCIVLCIIAGHTGGPIPPN